MPLPLSATSATVNVRKSGRFTILCPLAENIWYGCAVVGVSYHMVCPNCNSTDLKKMSLIYAAGVHESRGRILGFFVGSGDGLLFGRYRGTNQNRLSKMVGPPRK